MAHMIDACYHVLGFVLGLKCSCFHTHHNKLGRLGEDLLPQFESCRGRKQVDAFLMQVACFRVDLCRPEKGFFWQKVKVDSLYLCQIK